MVHTLRTIAGRILRRSALWFPLSEVPADFFGRPKPGAIANADQALTLSAYWCGLRLYQTTVASLPLVVYRKAANGGRTRAEDSPAYYLLHEFPNPAQSRAVLWELAVRDMFQEGEAFLHVRKNELGELTGLYRIKPSDVLSVAVDDEWRKAYYVQTPGGPEVYRDDEIIHLFLFSIDGVRGVPLVRYAAEALGLHRQVLESAGLFYQNAVRPSGYLKYPNKLTKEGAEAVKKWFKDEYAGPTNTGKLPVIHEGGEFVPFSDNNANDARIIEALGASVDDIARWLGVSPLLLYNLARGTYSNLGAENTAFYQRTIRPLLDKIELEVNRRVFGPGSDLYAEFLTQAILRGDPQQQAEVAASGIQNGWLTRAEQRELMNLPPVAGLERPLMPVNMASIDQAGDVIPFPTAPAQTVNTLEQPSAPVAA